MHYAPVKKVVDAIGVADAVKLFERCGGQVVYLPLPENIDQENQVAKAIGIAATVKLAQAFDFDGDPDRHIEIALGRRQLQAFRKDEILRDSQNMGERELALKHGTSQRHIRKILAAAPKPKHPELF